MICKYKPLPQSVQNVFVFARCFQPKAVYKMVCATPISFPLGDPLYFLLQGGFLIYQTQFFHPLQIQGEALASAKPSRGSKLMGWSECLPLHLLWFLFPMACWFSSFVMPWISLYSYTCVPSIPLVFKCSYPWKINGGLDIWRKLAGGGRGGGQAWEWRSGCPGHRSSRVSSLKALPSHCGTCCLPAGAWYVKPIWYLCLHAS